MNFEKYKKFPEGPIYIYYFLVEFILPQGWLDSRKGGDSDGQVVRGHL